MINFKAVIKALKAKAEENLYNFTFLCKKYFAVWNTLPILAYI